MLAIVCPVGWNRVNLKPVRIKKNKVLNFPSNYIDDEKYSASFLGQRFCPTVYGPFWLVRLLGHRS